MSDMDAETNNTPPELTPPDVEIQAGAAALKSYLDGILEANGLGWEEMFIPDADMAEGAQGAIEAADAADDQTTQGRVTAAAAEIQNAVNAAGYADMVSPTNCNEAAAAILVAVAKVRAQENPPAKPQPAPEPAPVVQDPAPVDQPQSEGVAREPEGGFDPAA